MPLAPTSVMTMPISKPKIGFSIDSIVGNRNLTKSPNSECSETPLSPVSDYGYPSDYHNSHQRSPKLPTSPAELHRALRLPENCTSQEFQQRLSHSRHNNNNISKPESPPPQTGQHDIFHNIHRFPESPPISRQDSRNAEFHKSPSHRTHCSPDTNRMRRSSPTPSPEPAIEHPQGPIMVPSLPGGLIRPYPMTAGPPPPPLASNGMDMKSMPAYLNQQDMAQQQHFLAAQFQAAAALAQHGFPPGTGLPPHSAHFNNPNVPRDSYPLYPWLLSRHGRIFPHRFPGSKYFQGHRLMGRRLTEVTSLLASQVNS